MELVAGNQLPAAFARPDPETRFRVFYFMRTGDCPVCRVHVRRLLDLKDRLAGLGASVTVLVPEESAPKWAAGFALPVAAAPELYALAGFHRTLGAIQQSGTLVADANGQVLSVRRATLPFQAFDEHELLALLETSAAAA